MKSLARKWVYALVSSVMMVSLFAGCNAGSSGNGSANKDVGAKAADQGQKPNTASNQAPLSINFLLLLYNDVPDMKNKYYTELQKRTNTTMNIQWIPSSDYGAKFDLMLASGDIPEVVVGSNQNSPNLVTAIKNGAFWDLTPFLKDFGEYPNLKKNADSGIFNFVKVDKKIWAIPRMRATTDQGIKFRKDWLDKLKLPVPTTLDEYRNALKKIVDSNEINAKKDVFGLIGDGFLPSAGPVRGAFGALDPIYDKDGGLMRDILTPEYTEMVGWYRQLYSDGVLPKEFSTMKTTQAEEVYQSGRAASYTRNIWRDYSFEQEIRKVQKDAEVITLPPLKGPKGISVDLSKGYVGAFYISKKVPEDKVKRLLKYFDLSASEELTEFAYYGIKDVHHKVVDGQKQLTELGQMEVNPTGIQPLALGIDRWAKVTNPAAPKAYNDAKKKQVEEYDKIGKKNIFEWLVSDTWTKTWPKYDNEWQSNVIKAVVGQISMDDYKKYVEKLVNMPELKKAFQEYAQAEKDFR